MQLISHISQKNFLSISVLKDRSLIHTLLHYIEYTIFLKLPKTVVKCIMNNSDGPIFDTIKVDFRILIIPIHTAYSLV